MMTMEVYIMHWAATIPGTYGVLHIYKHYLI